MTETTIWAAVMVICLVANVFMASEWGYWPGWVGAAGAAVALLLGPPGFLA